MFVDEFLSSATDSTSFPIFSYCLGTVISGEIHVNQSDSNSRELDVEIHYSIKDPSEEVEGGRKKVTARMVQLFKVR